MDIYRSQLCKISHKISLFLYALRNLYISRLSLFKENKQTIKVTKDRLVQFT